MLLLSLLLSACAPSPRAAPDPARCGPGVPETAQHPIALQPLELAGEYDLVQVHSQPAGSRVITGRLHLSPLDSTSKAAAAGGAVRDLVGWLELSEGDSAWRAAVSSRDPARPGVALAGVHLRIGPSGYVDGLAHDLEITAVAPEGFWGWWKASRGLAVSETPSRRVLPDPAGYFCALRVSR